MPKLPQEAQQAAEDSDSREPLEESTYVVRLRNVDGTQSGGSGPYWRWEFEVAHDEESSNNGRRLWNNTSLSKKAAWKLKESFDAFGVGLDTDTDELCGELCLASVVQEVIQSGKRMGEIGNQIAKLIPLPEDYELFDDDRSGSDEDDYVAPVAADDDGEAPF